MRLYHRAPRRQRSLTRPLPSHLNLHSSPASPPGPPLSPTPSSSSPLPHATHHQTSSAPRSPLCSPSHPPTRFQVMDISTASANPPFVNIHHPLLLPANNSSFFLVAPRPQFREVPEHAPSADRQRCVLISSHLPPFPTILQDEMRWRRRRHQTLPTLSKIRRRVCIPLSSLSPSFFLIPFPRCVFEKHRRGRKPGSKLVSHSLSLALTPY